MRFSLRLNNNLPVRECVRLARAAEQAGFDQFWVSDDLFLRSAPVILAAVATATERIQIGTCIVNPYTLHVAEIAMLAATLDELSSGRFNLGIAVGAAQFLKWIGVEQERPVAFLREAIHALRLLFQGERASLNGEFLRWTDEAYLRFTPLRHHIPIYIGALSPNMLRLIGEIADGGLPLLFPPEHYVNILPYVQEGLARSERTLETLDLAACVWCSIGEDRAAAEQVLREKIAYYGHALSPLIWTSLGVQASDFAPVERAAMVEGDLKKAASLVTPPMLRIGILGDSRELIERLEGLVALGVRHLSLGPPLGPDPHYAIELFGRNVIPHFSRHRLA
ncbi:MAG: LLM class flavin-dependent oxidoreductase [Anaerolineae bacterium]|nr:LLM class flavin-dependent oxidoreductase [Anaerolineae bacterium]